MREKREEEGFHLEPSHSQCYGVPRVSTVALHTQVEATRAHNTVALVVQRCAAESQN